MGESWGVGNQSNADAFDQTKINSDTVDLIFGEHPHSRRDNTVYARWSDGRIEGFDGHRLLHDVTFHDYNYLKESGMSGNQVRKGGECKISINGKPCASFFYRDVREAIFQAREMIGKIHNLPIQIWNEDDLESLVGRKVYYHNHPAVITMWIDDQGCVVLKPDHPDGLPFPRPAWRDEDDDENDYRVKDEIFSPHIWWWRDD